MSDLDRMVDAPIDARVAAYRPAEAPPFSVLTERKRRRDRRRLARTGAGLVAAAAAVAVAAAAVPDWNQGGLLDTFAGGDEGGGTTFALRPIGFQNDRAPAYTAAAERCLSLPGVTGGPVTDTAPAVYSLAAAGGDVAALRSCVNDIGADVGEIVGRPGEERGQAESIEQCVRGETSAVEERYIGMTESQVRDAEPEPVRVICRDRVFLDRTSDYRPDRLNIVVEQGVVVWAGRF